MWMRWRQRFKSHWFYWHTGHKWIAIFSMLASTLILWLSLGMVAGFSLAGIILAVLLDAVGFWLALVYLLFLRPYLPELSGLKGSVDVLMIKELVLPMLIGFFSNRMSSFIVAKIGGYSFESNGSTQKSKEARPERDIRRSS